jgi:hypothetical protein
VRTAVLVLFVAGCGFHAVGNNDGASGDDLGASGDDLAGSPDLYGIPPGSDLANTSGGSCPAPVLLVGVENLHNGDSGGGRVARIKIGPTTQSQCATLSGQGLIAPQPLAVAAFSSGVAAATRDGIYVIEPATDRIKWSKPAPSQTTWLPLDAFSIVNPGTGGAVIAVAYGPGGNPSTIREVDVFDDAGAPAANTPWCIQGSGCTGLPLSLGILSMTATPTDPSHLFVLDYSTPAAAWDLNPWTQTKTQYLGAYTENLGSIYAVVSSGTARYAWLDQTSAAGALQYATDSGSGPSAIGGPIKCASGCSTILHVVPDPTTPDGYFLLCDGTTVDTRTVVRMNGAGACTTILDGAPFGAESRLSRLGVFY